MDIYRYLIDEQVTAVSVNLRVFATTRLEKNVTETLSLRPRLVEKNAFYTFVYFFSNTDYWYCRINEFKRIVTLTIIILLYEYNLPILVTDTAALTTCRH